MPDGRVHSIFGIEFIECSIVPRGRVYIANRSSSELTLGGFVVEHWGKSEPETKESVQTKNWLARWARR
jgi:hypothetical protein